MSSFDQKADKLVQKSDDVMGAFLLGLAALYGVAMLVIGIVVVVAVITYAL